MKVERIAECSLEAFCNTYDLHYAIFGLEYNFFGIFESGRFRQVLLYLLYNDFTKVCCYTLSTLKSFLGDIYEYDSVLPEL